MTAPAFSVVIPCYNRAETVLPTLKSVQDQTCADFECLVVDDGSADGEALAAVVAGLGDARFRVIRRENGGGGAARNTGIEAARGRWIAFLDSDDLFLPGKLAVARAALATASPETVFWSRIIVDRGAGVRFLKPPRPPRSGERIDEYLMCSRGFIQTSTIVMARELAARVRFDPNLPYSQDTDFCVRAAAQGARFVMEDAPTVIWADQTAAGRVSSNSRTETLERWLASLQGVASPRAIRGYRGWHLARFHRAQRPGPAARLYLSALLHGCYGPRLATVIALQILVPRGIYRRLADLSIRLRHPAQRARGGFRES